MPCSPRRSQNYGRCGGGRGRGHFHHPYHMMGHPFFHHFMSPENMEEMSKNMEEMAAKIAEKSKEAAANGDQTFPHPFFHFMNPDSLEDMAKNMAEMAKKMSEDEAKKEDTANSEEQNREKQEAESKEERDESPHCQNIFSFMADIAKNVAENMPTENIMEEEVAAQLFPQKNATRWNESEDTYTFEMDVPGVQRHQVVIEEKAGDIEVSAIRMKNDDEIEKSYQESLYISPSIGDLDRAFATLIDGVLTITVPKKTINEPVDLIPEEGAAPPTPATTEEEFRYSMDMPGVKARDLKVQARGNEGKVYVEASRQLGNRTMTIKRIIEVQPPSSPMEQARVFLQDGVFTLVVLTTSTDDDEEKKPAGMRTIYVAQDEVPFASLYEEEGSTTKNVEEEGLPEAMVVETVAAAEADSDKETWEQVNEDANN